MGDYWVADYGVEPKDADEGEDIEFWWEINTGPEVGASDYLYVYVDGDAVGSTPLYFEQDPGTKETYTITWSTSSGDEGTYDVSEGGDIEAYTGDNDYMEGITITIKEGHEDYWVADYGVRPTEAGEGEDIEFWWKINTDPEAGASDYLYVYVDGDAVGNTPLYFEQDPGTQETYTITWSTSSGDQGTYDVSEGSDIEAYTGGNDYMDGITITIVGGWKKVATFGSAWSDTLDDGDGPENNAGNAVRSSVNLTQYPSFSTEYENDTDHDKFISTDVYLTVEGDDDDTVRARIIVDLYNPNTGEWVEHARAEIAHAPTTGRDTPGQIINNQQMAFVVPSGFSWRYREDNSGPSSSYFDALIEKEHEYELNSAKL